MKRNQNLIRFAVAVMLLPLYTPVEAQQPKKVPPIGILSNAVQFGDSGRYDAFRQGLRELGTWAEETL